MSYEAKLLDRLKQLVEKGEQVIATTRQSSTGMSFPAVDEATFFQWQAGALSFLKTVFGEDNTHFQQLSTGCVDSWYSDAVKGQAVLKAAREDLEGGYLISIEELVSADVFSDFLEVAQHLLEKGYKDPAASLIGAVLENGLRRIGRSNDVQVRAGDDLSALDQKLAHKQVYNRLTQKRVRVWTDVRNHADHGHFSKYDAAVVEEMLNGVRTFLEAHLQCGLSGKRSSKGQ